MSAEVRALYPTRCHLCRDVIARSEPILFHDDHPIHPECERSHGWNDEPNPIAELQSIVKARGPIMADLLAADYDIEVLSEQVKRALFAVVAAEGSLDSLLHDIAAEHRED